jgi:hypothetical protein
LRAFLGKNREKLIARVADVFSSEGGLLRSPDLGTWMVRIKRIFKHDVEHDFDVSCDQYIGGSSFLTGIIF